jgi:hypothetical protein
MGAKVKAIGFQLPAASWFRLDAFGFISRNCITMISGLRPLSPLWCLRHHLSPQESVSLDSRSPKGSLRIQFPCPPAKAGALWMLDILLHGSKVKRRANFPLRGKSRAAGIGVHFHRPQGGWLVVPGRSPVVKVFAAVRRHLYWRRKAPYLANAVVLHNSLGGALNPSGRRSRSRTEPLARRGSTRAINLRPRQRASTFGNTGKHRLPLPKLTASNIAHSKKAQSFD